MGSKIRQLASLFPPCVVIAVLKWMTSALCTTARFQKCADECHLCGTFGGDRIDHLACCSSFHSFSATFWGYPISINRLIISTLQIAGVPLEFGHFCTIALHLYSCLKIYNHARAFGRANDSLYRGFIVQLASRSHAVGQHVVRHRQASEVAAPG